MGVRVLDALEGVVDGRVLDDAEPELYGGFTEAEQQLVLDQIAVVRADEKPYRLDPAMLDELGFTEEERAAVTGHLVESGVLTDSLTVARDYLPYFRNVNNAYGFALPDLPDYGMDVFFLLHAVSTELAAAIDEIVELLDARVGEQRQAVHDALADAFGLPAATAAAIARP